MGSALAQVALPEFIRHDNDNYKEYGNARRKERQLDFTRSGLLSARFAYGRRNAIRALILARFGGPCLTDDADLLAELLVPFIVEAAALHKAPDGERRCPEAEAARFLRKVLPRWTESHGRTLERLVAEAVAKRDEAVARHDPTRGTQLRWLPSMPTLVAALRITREEARHLRGWACIDPATPEEKREADAIRKRRERAAKGATPRTESKSAVKPWIALGMSRATWYRRQRDAETNTSAPYSGTYGPDVFVSTVAANDTEPPRAAA